jgi:hypothetical protein
MQAFCIAKNKHKNAAYTALVEHVPVDLCNLVFDYILAPSGMTDFELGLSDCPDLHVWIQDADQGMCAACKRGDVTLAQKMLTKGAKCLNHYLSLACRWQKLEIGYLMKHRGARECYEYRCGPTCRSFGRLS